MLPGLEMRVGEAEEEVRELAAVENVGEELHGVGAEDGDVLIWTGSRPWR